MTANDLSISGTGAAAPVDRAASVKPVKLDVPGVKQGNAPVIANVKQLKQAEARGEQVPVSEGQLIRSIERAIKAMEGANTQLEFSIHGKTKQIMVKVLNKDTGETIREIPPEKTLDFVAKMWEMAGILVDERR
ncbi:flagellar protein FlaG [Gorillibacterium timonense]|uniref:flagellar protein FlaG n=1 Tax=Gorillibacterium timonense TaxID=1689269 RepID=UPI00071C3424|nr:flagellar protein FlaG [Gorillibacterium timonense]